MYATYPNMSAAKPTTSKLKRHLIHVATKSMITRLTDPQVLREKPTTITELEVTNICLLLHELFLEEPACLNLPLDDKLYIVGDIHGHYKNLLQILNNLGHPPETKYLFLGNYCGRGEGSLEVLALLFAYKLLYPRHIHLLRGKNECHPIGKALGLETLCTKRFSNRLWGMLTYTFSHLPIAAMVDYNLFCTHSGISPSLLYSCPPGAKSLQEFISVWVTRPVDTDAHPLIVQTVWSEPENEVEQWDRNPSGMGYLFGRSIVHEFCARFELAGVIRSSDVLATGFEFFVPDKMLSIFSTPDYLGVYKNYGAVVELGRAHKSQTMVARVKRLRSVAQIRGKFQRRSVIQIEETKIKF